MTDDDGKIGPNLGRYTILATTTQSHAVLAGHWPTQSNGHVCRQSQGAQSLDTELPLCTAGDYEIIMWLSFSKDLYFRPSMKLLHHRET